MYFLPYPPPIEVEHINNKENTMQKRLGTLIGKGIKLKKKRSSDIQDKKEEIWLSPMTKAPTPTEMSKGQNKRAKIQNTHLVLVLNTFW